MCQVSFNSYFSPYCGLISSDAQIQNTVSMTGEKLAELDLQKGGFYGQFSGNARVILNIHNFCFKYWSHNLITL